MKLYSESVYPSLCVYATVHLILQVSPVQHYLVVG